MPRAGVARRCKPFRRHPIAVTVGGMTEITDDLPARLLHEEHAGWRAIVEGRGGEHYQRAMTRDALMVVEGAMLGRDEILARCDGARPLMTIVADLEKAFSATGLRADVEAFLAIAAKQRWVVGLEAA